MLSVLKKLVRQRLEKAGYYLQSRAGLPWGFDYLLDIERLSAGWKFPINSFFDVGANVGHVSAEALDRLPAARVTAFEPTPDTFKKLKDRLGHNPRFTAHQIALSDKAGSVAFFQYESPFFNSLVPNAPTIPGYNTEAVKTQVRCETLDSFCKLSGISSVDIIKIDAERCDLLVLKGASQMLSSCRFVYFEFNNATPRHGIQETTFTEVANFLAPHQFRLAATYIDRIDFEPQMFLVANALFVRPPN